MSPWITLIKFSAAMWLAVVLLCVVMAVTLRGLDAFADWLFT